MAEEQYRNGNAIIGGCLIIGAIALTITVIMSIAGNYPGRYQPVYKSGSSSVYAFDTWTGNYYLSKREVSLPANRPPNRYGK